MAGFKSSIACIDRLLQNLPALLVRGRRRGGPGVRL